jgi:hypothetical protein
VTAETTVGTTSAAPTESPAEETSQPQDTATTSTSTAMVCVLFPAKSIVSLS